MTVSATAVRDLREKTGAGMMDCKKALAECAGDFEKAVDYLRAKGLAAAAKKQSRTAAEGIVTATVEGAVGVVVEVNCETDFVAKNPEFQTFVSNVASHLLTNNAKDVEDLKTQTIKGKKVTEWIQELTLKIGEKIDVRRFEKRKLNGDGKIAQYVHNGKIGVLVEVTASADAAKKDAFTELMSDLCLHVAAADPKFLHADQIDESFKEKEAEVYAAQLREQGKDEKMIPNIVKGKLNKLASEVCLNEQKFVKNPDISIAQLIKEVEAKVGSTLKICGFSKITLGEGIEKKQDNLAEEVAKMTQQN